MDYNKLQTFSLVAEAGSITAAAKKMRRSQSAISQQILALEDELQLRLLERRNGRVYLSPDGERIHSLTRENLGAVRDGIVALQKSSASVEGHIAIGALNDFGTDFDVGRAIGSFAALHPGVTFSILTGTSRSLEEALIANQVDLAFLVVFREPGMFVRAAVEKSWHSLYTSTEYARRHRGRLEKCRDLLDKELVDLDEEFMGIGTFIRKNAPTLYPTLRHRRPNIIAPNLAVAKQIVLAGGGIAMLPDFLVAREVRDKRMVRLLPSAKPLYGILDVAYRINRTPRLCESLFVRHVVSNAGAFRLEMPSA